MANTPWVELPRPWAQTPPASAAEPAAEAAGLGSDPAESGARLGLGAGWLGRRLRRPPCPRRRAGSRGRWCRCRSGRWPAPASAPPGYRPRLAVVLMISGAAFLVPIQLLPLVETPVLPPRSQGSDPGAAAAREETAASERPAMAAPPGTASRNRRGKRRSVSADGWWSGRFIGCSLGSATRASPASARSDGRSRACTGPGGDGAVSGSLRSAADRRCYGFTTLRP